jgi:glycosyltransferase involved in cell wall biosynthesis
MKSVSIVINTLNRASFLRNTLQSFLHLDFENFEVIVVNGPSTDATADILEQWKDKIKIGHCPEANLSKSRNIGIAMAAGEFVVFIDDDAIPEPEWLDQIMLGFDSTEVGGTGGKVFDHTGYTYQYQYANADRLGHGKWYLTKPFPHYCYSGAYEFPYLQGTNAAFRRTALLEIGGFDEEFIFYLDETEVCLRLIDRGYVIKQLPNAYVHHKYAPSYIRTKTTAIYRYPVLKSKVYFSNRHARPYHSQHEIDIDNLTFMQNQRIDVTCCVQTGRLNETDLNKFEEHVRDALRTGKEAASQPPKLITEELLQRHNTAFKKFASRSVVNDALTIVLLCEDYPPNLLGGIARFTQDKANALAKLGHKVHVIARSHTHNTIDFENGVWVYRIVAASHLIPNEHAWLNIPQSHWDQSKSFLNEIDRISMHRKVDVVEAPIWNIVAIATLLSKHYPIVTTLMTTLKLSLPSRPDLTQSLEAMTAFVNPLVTMEKYLITESEAILAISEGIAKEIQSAYDINISNDRLFVSHLGMPDWALGYKNAEDVIPTDTIDILFVGRLEKRKGIDLLLEVIPALVDQFPEIRFHIVGDDTIPSSNGMTYRQQFEQQYSQCYGSYVHFYGKVEENALRKHYFNCDIFVAPSRFESFGLIYVEAMMFGKPTVGCDVGGIPEVVDHNVTGMLVSPNNAVDLQCALETLVRNDHLRKEYGLAGRKKYEHYFSDLKMAKSSIEIYQATLASCSKAQTNGCQ